MARALDDTRGVADLSSTLTGRSPLTATGLRAAGLDLIGTQIAVDFQNLRADDLTDQIQTGLQSLTEATGADAVFIAILDAAGKTIEEVYVSRATFSACNPEVLTERALADFPWIKRHLEHLRLLEIRDTGGATTAQQQDADELIALNVGALTAVGFELGKRPAGLLGIFSSTPNPQWGADLAITLKLVGVSFASGLDRLRLEEDLSVVRERDHLVTSTANDGLWDYDVRGNSMYFSPRWRAMLGYQEDDEVPEWRFLVHPDDMARVQAEIREHLEGQTSLFESVHRMRHADGGWRWVQSRVIGRVDDQKRLRRLVGVETDITERKLYEEALFREKESAQITLQSIGDGVVTTDAESNVVLSNRSSPFTYDKFVYGIQLEWSW